METSFEGGHGPKVAVVP